MDYNGTEKYNLKDCVTLSALFGLLLLFVFGPVYLSKTSGNQNLAAAVKVATVSNPFDLLQLEAKSAYVLDAGTGAELFSLNGESQLPLASLTKIMTALTALSVSPPGLIVKIDEADLNIEGNKALYANESWKLSDLLKLTLVESSNSGAFAVSSAVGLNESGGTDKVAGREHFIRLMNEKAGELGLIQTYFLNETGLDVNSRISGGYGSARDISNLLAKAVSLYPEIFERTRYRFAELKSLDSLKHTATNTNQSVDKIPFLTASKTGFTDLAGGNLSIVFEAGFNRPIVVTVLGSSKEGRFSDAEKLAWAALEYLSSDSR